MTKAELKGIVDRIFLMWNQQINPISQKELYNGWWRVLLDLEETDVQQTIDELVIENGYMPRAGEVRRRTINRIHGVSIPAPIEAWQQFREAADASHSGTYQGKQMHDLVGTTVKALGGTQAYSLHTNGDREQFLSMYDRVVRDYEAKLYALPQSQ